MHLLGLSGSLRAASSNTELLRAAAALAPGGVTISLTGLIDSLPHFSPDLEPSLPIVARAFRAEVTDADGLLISCPEYAHGVPGSFKNALDWLVGGPEFLNKPVAFLNVSARGTWAAASLRETVTVMTGRISDEGSLTLPLMSGPIDGDRIMADPDLRGQIREALARFAAFIESPGP
jgi:chromate reductase, NAD(P)H dehydrogenase (quinone)